MEYFTSKVESLSSRGQTQRMKSWLVPSVKSADAFSSSCTQVRAILQSSTQHWFYSTQCSSPSIVWLPRRLPPSESSFYSSMQEKLCIFLMVASLVLSRHLSCSLSPEMYSNSILKACIRAESRASCYGTMVRWGCSQFCFEVTNCGWGWRCQGWEGSKALS